MNWEVQVLGSDSGGEEKEKEKEEEEEEGGKRVWVPWEQFRATYRGKEIEEDAGNLKTEGVRRVGIMMRRHVFLLF